VQINILALCLYTERNVQSKERGNKMQYDESGWIYPDKIKNEIHIISEKDINQLLSLADEDDAWSNRVREEVKINMNKPKGFPEIMLDEIRLQNTAGTIIQFPYGGRIITFNSSKHLYRGENKIFQQSHPLLNRKLIGKDEKEQELYRAVANLRIEQFTRFIWNISVVPYWTAKLSDVNFKALAQHYGFETHLLDFTNDFKVALFFATCEYVPETDSYIPLTSKMIEAKDENKYGVIYHSPNWRLDYLNGYMSFQFFANHKNVEDIKQGIDSGDFDGMAFQIGYQPLMRCHNQSGYLFPMRNRYSLQADDSFEILRFKQSPELSQRVFEMMEGGKKVFPYEGISDAKSILDQIKRATVFSEVEIYEVYNQEVNKSIFSTVESFKNALTNMDYGDEKIKIEKDEIVYPISMETFSKINKQYDDIDLLKQIGGMIHMKPEDREYLEQNYNFLYGELKQ